MYFPFGSQILRNNFRSNVWTYIVNSDTYNEMNDYISFILANDEDIHKILLEYVNDERTESNPIFEGLVTSLLKKFFDYYLNTATKDFNTKVLPRIEQTNKTANNKNVPWRVLLQLENVTKT